MPVTAELLRLLGVSATPEVWAPAIEAACQCRNITTPRRLAAFLATVLHETAELSCTVENLNYTPEALCRTWPAHFGPDNAQRIGRTAAHGADQHLIAELAYGNRLGNGKPGCGDGWTYRGRGLIQLTGKANYQRFASLIGVPLADLPGLLEQPVTSADVAARFWQVVGCNEAADAGDIATVRRLVNGGEIGLDDVTALYARALKAIEAQQPKSAPPVAAPDPAPAASPLAAPVLPTPTGWTAVLDAVIRMFRKGA